MSAASVGIHTPAMGVLPWCMVGALFTTCSQLRQGCNSYGMQKHIKKVHLSLSWALQGAQIHLSSTFNLSSTFDYTQKGKRHSSLRACRSTGVGLMSTKQILFWCSFSQVHRQGGNRNAAAAVQSAAAAGPSGSGASLAADGREAAEKKRRPKYRRRKPDDPRYGIARSLKSRYCTFMTNSG